jgi:hypothetical protein
MKKFFKSLFSDERGSISSKRIVGLLCSFILCITLYHNSFSEKNVAPSDILVESVALLAFGCLGLTSLDKFTFNKEKKQEDEHSESNK